VRVFSFQEPKLSRDGNGNYTRVPGSGYANGTTADGPEVDAEMDDIATALTQSLSKDGQTVPSANLPMGGFRHTNVDDAAARTDYARADQVQDSTFTTLTSVSGTDTITASAPIGLAAYATGQEFRLVSAGANTGAVTLDINGLGAKAVTKRGTTALVAGDIASGEVVRVVYDGTRFQIAADPAVVRLTGDQDVAGVKAFAGTATNDSAATGKIGEYVSAELLFGSATALTTATSKNVTSISLTAGDWDVSGMCGFTLSNTSTIMQSSISLTSATQDVSNGAYVRLGAAGTLIGTYQNALPTTRISIASTTTVYVVAEATFASGSNAAFGRIMARRVR